MFKTAVEICSLNYLIVLEVKCLPGNGSNFILCFMTCAVNISRRAVVSCEARRSSKHTHIQAYAATTVNYLHG